MMTNGTFELSLLIDLAPKFVDNRGGTVLLLFGGESFVFIENHLRQVRLFLTFLGLWDGCDEISPAVSMVNLLGRLALFVQFPVL